MSVTSVDVVVVGAGAAGLFCAAQAGRRGRSVLILEHARKPAEKVRISGGGRCNFTNVHASPENYISQNPRFCASALAQYTAQDFVDLVKRYRIAYHEKKLGQLFCDGSSTQIVDMLLAECALPNVRIRMNYPVSNVTKPDNRFNLEAGGDRIECSSLVVASGGLSIPKMGASSWGYDLARRFGHNVVPTWPALVPFVFTDAEMQHWPQMAGVATDAEVKLGSRRFREALLYTHRGLSGPSILQISSYWTSELPLEVNLSPDHDAVAVLLQSKKANVRQELATVVTSLLPRRLATRLCEQYVPADTRLSQIPDDQLRKLGTAVNRWCPQISGTEGYRTAEVTGGGVETRELSSQTLESRKVPGLYFIGEVVDVTGHLGGYNFQWAWSSAAAAGRAA